MKGPKSKTEEFLRAHQSNQEDECLSWPFGRDSIGYGRAKVTGYSTRLAHRIMCEMAHGKPPSPKSVARHTCGNGHMGCVNPKHLCWGSVADNNQDKIDAGKQPVGEAIGVSVLSERKVREIRALGGDGMSQRRIAKAFGVSHGTIQAVLEGRTWRHVQ